MEFAIIDNAKYFVRKDSDNVWTILIKTTGHQFYVNRIGYLIIEKMAQIEDTEDIKKFLYVTFPDVNRKIIDSDFEDIFNLMVLYELVSIKSVEKELKLLKDRIVIKFAGDGDYREINRFIKCNYNRNKHSMHNFQDDNYFSPISLRYHTFNNSEYYCIGLNQNSEITSLISVRPPVSLSTVATINSFVYHKDLKAEEINNINKKSINFIFKKLGHTLTKIRVNVVVEESNMDFESLLMRDLLNIGFKKECELIKEQNNSNMIMYSLFV